jgi:hypothetical protein
MKTFLILLAAALFVAFAAHAASGDARNGVWTAELHDDRLDLTMFRGSREGHRGMNMMGFNVPLAEIGLAKADAESAAANVTFAMKREAGTIEFDGRFATGDGAGQYRFKPNDDFEHALNELGYDELTDNDMLVYAAHDLRINTVRDLIAMQQKPTRRQLDEVAIFGITAQLLREYATAGFPNLSIREAVQMRIGQVDAKFISQLRDLGYAKLSAREISELGILGATPAYIRSMRDAGLTNLTPRDLTNLRVGNVTPKRIEELRRAGYDHLTAHELSDLGIHHITVEFIEELRKLGYQNLSTRELVDLKIHNVTADYIRSMTK